MEIFLVAFNLKGLLLFSSLSVYFGKEPWPEVLLILETGKCSSLLSFFWSSPIITHCRQLCVAFATWWLLNNWSWDVKYFPNELMVQSKSWTVTTIVRHFNVSASGWVRAVMPASKNLCMIAWVGRGERKWRQRRKESLSVIMKRIIIFKLLFLSCKFRNSALEWLILNISNSIQV